MHDILMIVAQGATFHLGWVTDIYTGNEISFVNWLIDFSSETWQHSSYAYYYYYYYSYCSNRVIAKPLTRIAITWVVQLISLTSVRCHDGFASVWFWQIVFCGVYIARSQCVLVYLLFILTMIDCIVNCIALNLYWIVELWIECNV